jgi:hypothetical protein
MARDVIIATFENRNQAYGAAKDIDKLDHSVINVQSGVIVERDLLGTVTWLRSEGLTSPWGTVGAIPAASGHLVPGHAALIAEVDEYSTQPVDEAVRRHGGVIFRHPTTYRTV